MTSGGTDFRESHAQVTSALVRKYGPSHLEPILDAVQDAFVAALQSWPMQGEPENPRAWLQTAAERRLIDWFRKTKREVAWPDQEPPASEPELENDELRLYFMVCSPKLKMGEQVCLILRTLGGLTAHEIAGLFHESEEAVQRRISRAKNKLSHSDLDDRQREVALPAVLLALYLMFTEGYEAQRGEDYLRPDLAWEALRLTSLLAESAGDRYPDLFALLSVMHFQFSRLQARTGDGGLPILLADQDQSLYNREHIAAGFAALQQAQSADRLSRYHIEAGLAAAIAADAPAVEILRWHQVLVDHFPTPMARVSHAVAQGVCNGPAAGLTALAALQTEKRILRTPHYHAAIGHFEAELGHRSEAAAAYRRAVALSMSTPVKTSFERRAAQLVTTDP